MTRCPICCFPALTVPHGDGGRKVTCEGCGVYNLTGSALAQPYLDRLRCVKGKFGAWVYDQNRMGAEPTIRSETVEFLENRRSLSVVEKINRFLVCAAEHVAYPGAVINLSDRKYLAVIGASDDRELMRLRHYLADRRLLEVSPGDKTRLTFEGVMKAEELTKLGADSSQGFVAMWFDPELQEAWDHGFAPAISNAGYRPLRIDKREHSNKIDDEIIAEIRRSRFVVADFTGQRGGVYFEAGFARGLGLPVVWTCHKEHLKDLHFDIRQFNMIDWVKPADLRQRLQVRIEAQLGDGPFKGAR